MSEATMQAWVYRRYGGPEVLELVTLPRPVARPGEVLIRIAATTVTAGDWRMRSLIVPPGFGLMVRLVAGITRPRQPILGMELAGTVAAVGPGVTAFREGDEVFGFTGGKLGCHAEYRTMRADGGLALRPTELSFPEAAALCFGGTTALSFLRWTGVKAGDRVLVLGGSGNVGSALVQLARAAGAEVSATTSGRNLELVQGLGASEVLDYARTGFAEAGRTWDVIFDTVAASNFEQAAPALAAGGRYAAIAGGVREMLQTLRPRDGKRVIAGTAEERQEDVRRLAELAAAGTFRPVIDRVYDFADMAAAHAHVDEGHKRGSVVVQVS